MRLLSDRSIVCQFSGLMSRIVGTRIRFANGDYAWALIGNLDTNNARMNDHFVTLSVGRNGNWFGLARYHDVDYHQRGPNALTHFLGLSVDEVFPITYDVRKYAAGEANALAGTVARKPRVRLTKAKLMALSIG